MIKSLKRTLIANFEFILKSIMFVICCFFLTYMVYNMCSEYFSYKTIVMIKIARPEVVKLPAISVCRKISPAIYYKALRKGQPVEESKVNTLNDIKHELDHYFVDKSHTAVTLYRLLKEKEGFIKCHVPNFDVRNEECTVKHKAIHSFNHKRMCTTFFSQLYVNHQVNESQINASKNFSESTESMESMIAWFWIENPYNQDAHILIHTSYSMPDVNLYDMEHTRTRIDSDKSYGILYDKKTVERQPPPYATQCNDYYASRTNRDDALSQFGCKHKCEKSYWRNKKGRGCIPLDMSSIIEVRTEAQMGFCTCLAEACTDDFCKKMVRCDQDNSSEYNQVKENCAKSCRDECYEEYYTSNMFELNNITREELIKRFKVDEVIRDVRQVRERSLIFIAAKYSEEISYQHVPKMSFMELFANLGGLFSLWLGASVLMMFDVLLYLYKFFKTIRQKFADRKNVLFAKVHGYGIRHRHGLLPEVQTSYSHNRNFNTDFGPRYDSNSMINRNILNVTPSALNTRRAKANTRLYDFRY